MGRSGVLDVTTFEALDASCKEEVMGGGERGKRGGRDQYHPEHSKVKIKKTNIAHDVGAER